MSAAHDLTKAVLVVCATGLGLSAAAPAVAKEGPVIVYGEARENVRTRIVSFADLDLASAAGAKSLHYRVGRAVKKVCLFDDGGPKLQPSDYHDCADGAWEGARPQMAQALARAQSLAASGAATVATAAITVSAGR